MFRSEVTGIDISPQSIKVVSVKSAASGYVITRARSFASGAVNDDHSMDYHLLVKGLGELKKELPLFSRKVAISVPDSAVVCRSLQIDSGIQEVEREFAIYEAFSSVSPVAHQQLRIDFVEKTQSVQEDKVGYQVYAAKKEVVDERVNAVKRAKLTPVLVDTQSHGLLKVWEVISKRLNQANWLLLYIGPNQTTICSGAVSDSVFCQSIQKGLGCKVTDFKMQQKACDELADSVALQIQIYASATEPVEGVWVTGDTESLEPFRVTLERITSLQCQLLNPLEFIPGCNSVTGKYDSGYAYSLAVGIAIKGLCWVESA
ncbi:pilus assembly protein PilM [Vibrio hannami]|uniref:pilus assembly protein PilM n=1 Tax=Vibrio hannami TaxID=2717094 RepID=UPI00241020D2|nr:pilus assembly protein PilM [Vibrio hannami]MDG3084665.1 pilus assembly protein PilM [Vibrio hannami]